MRTEVKAGLIVGLIIIGGIVFYAVNRGGSSGQTDRIPWDLTVDEAGGTDTGDVAAGPADQPRLASSERTPAPRSSRSPGSPVRPAPSDERSERATSPTTETRPGGLRRSSDEVPRTGGVTTAPTGVGLPTSRPARAPVVTPTTRPSTRRPVAGIPRPSERPLRPGEPTPPLGRPTPRPKPAPIRYTIERGDTLYAIASAYYGEGRHWTKIRDANPDIDPDRLMEGQVILLPPKEDVLAEAAKRPQTAPADRPPGTRLETYVVGTGDTLTSIAREILGDGSRWKEIYDLNRDKLDDPDLLPEGIELRLPAVEKKGGE